MDKRKKLIGRKRLNELEKWLPALLVMAIIFTVSSTSGKVINAAGFGDEVYHVNGHFILFMLLCISYYKATKNVFHSIALTFIYAVLDETHQLFTPFRSSSIFDIAVDTAGAFISGGLIWRFQHILPKKLKNWLLK